MRAENVHCKRPQSPGKQEAGTWIPAPGTWLLPPGAWLPAPALYNQRMAIENPYESPRHAEPLPGPKPHSLLRGGATVLLCTAIGGALGLLVGAALGQFLPDYYRSVIPGGNQPDFQPLAVGIGLGLSQGCGLGALCGVGLAGLQFWFRARSS